MHSRTRAILSCAAVLLPLALTSLPAQADIYRTVQANGVPLFTNAPPRGGYQVVVRERPAPIAASPAARFTGLRMNSTSPYASSIRAAGRAADVDPALIHAVIHAESGYNPSARSNKGAVGLMQLMPETAQRYGVANRLDPAQNILGGARYLRDLLRMFNNDLRLTLAAYNAGEGAVMKYGNRIPPFRETVAYVPRVMTYYRRYRAYS